jgi:hypothetical protein
MHRKTQLFVTGEALAALARDPRTQDAIANQVTFTVKEGAAFDSEGLAKGDVDIAPLSAPYLAAFRDLPADLRERTVLYMSVGSQNKDARGMMTDGEVLQVTAGPWALWVVSDMWMLAGSTTSRSPRCAWAVGRSRHPATGRPITGATLAGDRLVMRTQHRLYSIRRPRSG